MFPQPSLVYLNWVLGRDVFSNEKVTIRKMMFNNTESNNGVVDTMGAKCDENPTETRKGISTILYAASDDNNQPNLVFVSHTCGGPPRRSRHFFASQPDILQVNLCQYALHLSTR